MWVIFFIFAETSDIKQFEYVYTDRYKCEANVRWLKEKTSKWSTIECREVK